MEMIPQHEVLVERDWCLRSLLSQADGRQVDNFADSYLIEAINASHVDDTEAGNVTQCRVGGCALTCLTTNERGILTIIETHGPAACDQ